MPDQELPNPTPQADAGGASTLDPLNRLEAMLQGAESGSDDSQGESQDQPAQDTVDPDGDGQKSPEPQLSTSDLAKLLKLEDGALDLDEEGNAVFKTKIDGQEGTAKLQDLLKSYQLQEHVDRKSREAAEREKTIQAREKEAEQQFQQRLQYADNLTQIAANQLMAEFQAVPWQQLEAENPGHAALLRQKFQERQAQLRGVYENIQRDKVQGTQKAESEMQQQLQREAERLPELIPEWKDAQVAQKERAEIRDWAIKAGYEPSEIDSISKAHHVAVLRKAMLADKLQKSRPEIENKVRQAPKLVKPGTQAADTQADKLQSIKTAVKKSGGKNGTVEQWLIAAGKV